LHDISLAFARNEILFRNNFGKDSHSTNAFQLHGYGNGLFSSPANLSVTRG